jgi:hypothetical protein
MENKLGITHTPVDNGGVKENQWVIKLPENCEVDIYEESGTITIQGGELDLRIAKWIFAKSLGQ